MNRQSEKRDKVVRRIVLLSFIAFSIILTLKFIQVNMAMRKRAYNSAAYTDVMNAYNSAQSYFAYYPKGTVSKSKLKDYGFKSSDEAVQLVIESGTKDTLAMKAFHFKGNMIYSVRSDNGKKLLEKSPR